MGRGSCSVVLLKLSSKAQWGWILEWVQVEEKQFCFAPEINFLLSQFHVELWGSFNFQYHNISLATSQARKLVSVAWTMHKAHVALVCSKMKWLMSLVKLMGPDLCGDSSCQNVADHTKIRHILTLRGIRNPTG